MLRIKAILLLLCSVLVTILVTVGCDRLVGHFRQQGPEPDGLLFPPNSRMIFRTTEFDSLAVVNSLGFRGHEFPVQKGAAYRIVALGDSFTFGWGVNIEDAWVKQLEDRLRQSGHNVEIADLGKSGASPRSYADLAERAIPLLKPDLVLVAVLQGDDLAQGGEGKRRPDDPGHSRLNAGGIRATVARNVRALYPNLTALVRPIQRSAEGTAIQAATWRKETKEVLERAGETGEAKFNSFDATVKGLFLEGKLNPGLLDDSIRYPDRFLATMELNNPFTRSLIVEMGNQLSRIKRVASRQNARVLVVPVPNRCYVSRFDWDQFQRLGFVVREDMLTSTAPDDAIRLACEKAGVTFHSVTDAFRRRVETRRLYFELDGHLNRDGNSVFSELLVPVIEGHGLANR